MFFLILENVGLGLLKMCCIFAGWRVFVLAAGDYYDRIVYKLCWVFCDSLKNEYFCNLDDCRYLWPCAVCRRGADVSVSVVDILYSGECFRSLLTTV